jgi:hypothetical protein
LGCDAIEWSPEATNDLKQINASVRSKKIYGNKRLVPNNEPSRRNAKRKRIPSKMEIWAKEVPQVILNHESRTAVFLANLITVENFTRGQRVLRKWLLNYGYAILSYNCPLLL